MSVDVLHPFEAAVLVTIRRRGLFDRRAHVLVALSGGADSTALLVAMTTLRAAGWIGAVSACHVDHQLRPNSAEDAAHCEALCARLGVPFERVEVEVRGANIQNAARQVRYAALRRAAERMGADRIATGHHRGDQAETVLQRLLRGAGARGLSGIPARRGLIVRPLIDRCRIEVLGYVRDRGLSWREDPSNATPRFFRNRLRNELLPELERIAPGLEARLARTADLLRADDRALERLAARAVPRGVRSVPVAALRALPLAVRRRALRRLWRTAAGDRELAAAHIEGMLRLLRAHGPKRRSLPSDIEARIVEHKEGPALELSPTLRVCADARSIEPLRIEGPGVYQPTGSALALEISWKGEGLLPWPLVLRTRRPGDRFRPAGGVGEKKLKAWLIDRKIPRARRASLLLVTDEAHRVLWLPELGVRAVGTDGLEVSLKTAARAGPGQSGARVGPTSGPGRI